MVVVCVRARAPVCKNCEHENIFLLSHQCTDSSRGITQPCNSINLFYDFFMFLLHTPEQQNTYEWITRTQIKFSNFSTHINNLNNLYLSYYSHICVQCIYRERQTDKEEVQIVCILWSRAHIHCTLTPSTNSFLSPGSSSTSHLFPWTSIPKQKR